MKKYVFGLLLALLIVMMAVPAMAELKINGQEINMTTGPFSGTGWTYTPDRKTLTLNGANWDISSGHAIETTTAGEIKEIILKGTNKITSTANDSAIKIQNASSVPELIISGTGSLTISADTYVPLAVYCDLKVQENAALHLISPANRNISALDFNNNKFTITQNARVSINHRNVGARAIGSTNDISVINGGSLEITMDQSYTYPVIQNVTVGTGSSFSLISGCYLLRPEDGAKVSFSSELTSDSSVTLAAQNDGSFLYPTASGEGGCIFHINQNQQYSDPSLWRIDIFNNSSGGYPARPLLPVMGQNAASSSVPKTGVASPVAAALPLLLGSVCGILFLRRKERKS